MSRKDYKTILGFTDEWPALGLVTEETLQQSGAFYEIGIDRSTEHYRYGAFRRYLKDHHPLSPSMAKALYALGTADADPAMGSAMIADTVSLSKCPPSMSNQAPASAHKHLIRLRGNTGEVPTRSGQRQLDCAAYSIERTRFHRIRFRHSPTREQAVLFATSP